MAFTVSRQKSRLFFTVNRQKVRVILTVKTFQGISNLTISTKFWLLKNLYTWKTTGHAVKNTHTLSFSLSEHYKTLAYNLKYLQIVFVKDQGYLQNTTVKY